MPKKILVADDSITIQTVFRMTLSKEDYDLTVVGDGKEALEKARQIHPDLIIADVNMPEKTGYELCEIIKKDPILKDIPVLILAGALEGIDEKAFIKAGGDAYLLKPFETKELFAKVNELLEKKQKGLIAVPQEEVVKGEVAEEILEGEPLKEEVTAEKEQPEETIPLGEEAWDFSDLIKEEELMEEIEDRTIELSELEPKETVEEVEEIIEGEPIEEEIPQIEFEKEAIELGEEEIPEITEEIPEITEELYIEEEIPEVDIKAKEEPVEEVISEEKPVAGVISEGKPYLPKELLDMKKKELVEKLSKEFFPQISELIVSTVIERIERIAWEVIPEIAEALVKEEIQKIRQSK